MFKAKYIYKNCAFSIFDHTTMRKKLIKMNWMDIQVQDPLALPGKFTRTMRWTSERWGKRHWNVSFRRSSPLEWLQCFRWLLSNLQVMTIYDQWVGGVVNFIGEVPVSLIHADSNYIQCFFFSCSFGHIEISSSLVAFIHRRNIDHASLHRPGRERWCARRNVSAMLKSSAWTVASRSIA